MNPELHLSQLSIAESCKFLESSEKRERRFSTFSTTSFKKSKGETQVILEEKGSGNVIFKHDADNNAAIHGQVEIFQERKGWRRYIGLLLTIVHVISFTLSALLVKVLKDYHPFTLAFWRFQGVFIPSAIVLIYHGTNFCKKNERGAAEKTNANSKPIFEGIWPPTNPGNWKNIIILFLRDITGCTALVTYFFALKYITVADTFVISAAGPCFVSILAFFFLKERLGIFTMVLILMTLSGVVLISRPPFLSGTAHFDDQTLLGFGGCVASTAIAALSFVLLRYLKHLHFAIISLSYGTWGTILSLIGACSLDVFHLPNNGLEILCLIGIAFLTFVAQISITLALQTEEAGVVSLLKTTNIIFAFIWQFIFLGVKPDLLSLAGASIVLVGCSCSVFRRWLSQLPENHRYRKTFYFVLK